jgi:hypothetical protein
MSKRSRMLGGEVKEAHDTFQTLSGQKVNLLGGKWYRVRTGD